MPLGRIADGDIEVFDTVMATNLQGWENPQAESLISESVQLKIERNNA
jgi:hypothetical protein